ncbi:hypothetical protein SASPL_112697 [Salvia splendens]|uniref:Uncharacterized protein n=1 Tax=Salvia splendens TaxID=180675 RepID=A0A8X8YEQ9_SALSN|nr:hypothetical protein SASPL_112697 [Salvia splendens]
MTKINYDTWGVNDGNPRSDSQPTRLGGPSSKLSLRMSDKFDRTKEVAATGMERTKEKTKKTARKVKTGATTGVNWIKVKCNQNKLFPKK